MHGQTYSSPYACLSACTTAESYLLLELSLEIFVVFLFFFSGILQLYKLRLALKIKCSLRLFKKSLSFHYQFWDVTPDIDSIVEIYTYLGVVRIKNMRFSKPLVSLSFCRRMLKVSAGSNK